MYIAYSSRSGPKHALSNISVSRERDGCIRGYRYTRRWWLSSPMMALGSWPKATRGKLSSVLVETYASSTAYRMRNTLEVYLSRRVQTRRETRVSIRTESLRTLRRTRLRPRLCGIRSSVAERCLSVARLKNLYSSSLPPPRFRWDYPPNLSI